MPKRQEQAPIDLPPRKRSRPKFDTSLIPMEDLYNSPSMTGLISFLERPPTSGEDITDLPAFRHLKKDHFPAPDIHGEQSNAVPSVDTVPSESTVSSERTVPNVSTGPVEDIEEHPPAPTQSAVSTIDTVLAETLGVAQRQEPAIELTPTESRVPSESTVLTASQRPTRSTVLTEITVLEEGVRKRAPSEGLHSTLDRQPEPSTSTVLKESAIVDRAFIGRQVGGRPVTNIHLLRTAQDGHSMAEDGLFRKLWETARAEQGNDRYRIVEIGYERAGALIHINKTGAKRLMQGLIDKLSIEVIANQNSNERIGKRYRIYSFTEIIRRRRTQGFTHFQKNRGGVTLVRGEGPKKSTAPIESTVLTEVVAH